MRKNSSDSKPINNPKSESQFDVADAVTPRSNWELPLDMRVWLEKFESRNGRALRVLHIGNIANNAYLNAKFLNRIGIQCDVMCFDYYHIMGCPEWEDVDFDRVPSDHNRPDWTAVDLGGYERPRWFAQGPLVLCIEYLLARAHGDAPRSEKLWYELGRGNRTMGLRNSGVGSRYLAITSARGGVNWLASRWLAYKLEVERWIWAASVPEKVSRRLKQVAYKIWHLLKGRSCKGNSLATVRSGESPKGPPVWLRSILALGINLFAVMISWFVLTLIKIVRGRQAQSLADDAEAQRRVADGLVVRFRATFPERPDKLSKHDVVPYQVHAALWRELFSHYEIVQAYAVDPLYPLITGFRPYVCFEHGTLRDFTMGDNPLHRLTALAYREADHVFITNGDCLKFAKRLGISSYSSMVHPVDIEQHDRLDRQTIFRMRAEFGADVLLFCPLRHDWSVKGTDVHIRALPLIRDRIQGRVKLLMSNWGNQLKESVALARDLGCEADIVWMPPCNRERMVKLTQAADVVLDQMILPHFGATAPQALAAGTPVVMSYRPESTVWIVSEPAPILAAFSPEDVAVAVEQALDPEWRQWFKNRARSWIYEHHSPARVVSDHVAVYRDLLEPQQHVSTEARA